MGIEKTILEDIGGKSYRWGLAIAIISLISHTLIAWCGMDTINLNKAHIDSLEQNYRKMIKSRLCVPDDTPPPHLVS